MWIFFDAVESKSRGSRERGRNVVCEEQVVVAMENHRQENKLTLPNYVKGQMWAGMDTPVEQ
jgi:hypothetical protein